jgi:hypothetical protein
MRDAVFGCSLVVISMDWTRLARLFRPSQPAGMLASVGSHTLKNR